jgi:hypothetical protein
MDIQAFSQAYWGTPCLGDLRRAGRLDVEDEKALVSLMTIFPSTPVWLADDF